VFVDVLQNIQAGNRIDLVPFQTAELRGFRIHPKTCVMGAVCKAPFPVRHTIFVNIDPDYMFPVVQMVRKVSHSAADLQHALTEFASGYPRLPLKVASRRPHALLIGDRILGSCSGNVHPGRASFFGLS
jgi:hypothetical protein